MVKIENEWFWGTSIHIIEDDGCALLKLVIDNRDREDCELYDLGTHPSRQRQGYATRLMQEAVNTARDRGCRRLLLWAVRGSWQEQWYTRLGFTEEEFRRPPDESVVWMVKFLKQWNEK